MLLFFSLFYPACFGWPHAKKRKNNENKTYTLSGNASGSLEVPPVTTTAAATMSGQYDSETNQLTYNIYWSGLSDSATGAHIPGTAEAGVNASVIHPLTITVNGITGAATGTITIADFTESHLLGGRLYYNIHTVQNEGGEVSRQLTATEN